MCLMIQFLIVQIFEEWSKGAFVIKPGDEDIHTANERRLKVSDSLDDLSRHQALALVKAFNTRLLDYLNY